MKVTKIDTRFVYSARCTWFGSINDVGMRGTLPCCPHCGSVLFECPDVSYWNKAVDEYDEHHPGYKDFIEWLRTRHFMSYPDAEKAYHSETGKSW